LAQSDAQAKAKIAQLKYTKDQLERELKEKRKRDAASASSGAATDQSEVRQPTTSTSSGTPVTGGTRSPTEPRARPRAKPETPLRQQIADKHMMLQIESELNTDPEGGVLIVRDGPPESGHSILDQDKKFNVPNEEQDIYMHPVHREQQKGLDNFALELDMYQAYWKTWAKQGTHGDRRREIQVYTQYLLNFPEVDDSPYWNIEPCVKFLWTVYTGKLKADGEQEYRDFRTRCKARELPQLAPRPDASQHA
jgi:hypothetical protein